MLTLCASSLSDRDGWKQAGVRLPAFDRDTMITSTRETPVWLHFGAGNIFRGFVARIGQELLNKGLATTGIIAVDSFDYEIIEKIYRPFDHLTLMADLASDGNIGYEIIGSVADAICADVSDAAQWEKLKAVFCSPSLQVVSFTVTEKGYSLHGLSGELLPIVERDIFEGPEHACHLMSVVTALLLERYHTGATPIAMSSMDNCSHNGDKLRDSVVAIASAWASRGFASEDFLDYLRDPVRVSFPWSMIDKITPRPSDEVTRRLTAMGILDMAPITTSMGTYIAPFVNAEIPQYLVLEDSFPNGRPAFESASVYLSDRDTVNRTERMKVTTCLNPLHTALAVFGCLLGYTRISDEMKDPDLRDLVYAIGNEGLPVVTDPKIMDPREFLREVLEERFPNPFIPDMPQRIATDTSLKLPIRYGETIKAYLADEHLVASDLTYIPLAIAGWFRYLIGMDDDGEPMEVSPDPQLPMLRQALSAVRLGDPDSRGDVLFAILRNEALFGTDLVAAGLAMKIDTMFGRMLEGNGAVRRILHELCHSEENGPA